MVAGLDISLYSLELCTDAGFSVIPVPVLFRMAR